MPAATLNRLALCISLGLSVAALLLVLSGFAMKPQPDEGAAAHLFQIDVVLVAPAVLLFLATSDWAQPLKIARKLMAPAITMALAFASLYYLEHFYYPHP